MVTPCSRAACACRKRHPRRKPLSHRKSGSGPSGRVDSGVEPSRDRDVIAQDTARTITLENLALRQQIGVLTRSLGDRRYVCFDKTLSEHESLRFRPWQLGRNPAPHLLHDGGGFEGTAEDTRGGKGATQVTAPTGGARGAANAHPAGRRGAGDEAGHRSPLPHGAHHRDAPDPGGAARARVGGPDRPEARGPLVQRPRLPEPALRDGRAPRRPLAPRDAHAGRRRACAGVHLRGGGATRAARVAQRSPRTRPPPFSSEL